MFKREDGERERERERMTKHAFGAKVTETSQRVNVLMRDCIVLYAIVFQG